MPKIIVKDLRPGDLFCAFNFSKKVDWYRIFCLTNIKQHSHNIFNSKTLSSKPVNVVKAKTIHKIGAKSIRDKCDLWFDENIEVWLLVRCPWWKRIFRRWK